MKLYWDISNSIRYSHRSGIHRVSLALGEALQSILGEDFQWVSWNRRKKGFQVTDPEGRSLGQEDTMLQNRDSWMISAEIFRERERKGFSRWRREFSGRSAFIFHDLIPLLYPDITWPKSVRRHPHYVELLAGAYRILSVSESSREDLIRYARKKGISLPQVEVLKLGSFQAGPPEKTKSPPPPLHLLQVGILEPRKNQDLLLDALEELWASNASIEITFVGRVNPRFGKPTARRIHRLRKAGKAITHLDTPDDETLLRCYREAHVTLLPSRAEGAGLPLLESTAMGTPVLCSDIPSFLEYGRSLEVRFFDAESKDSLVQELRKWIDQPQEWKDWEQKVRATSVPDMEATARQLLEFLKDSNAG